MLVLASYHIQDDADRSRMRRILKGHRERVHYSVFECWLEADDLARLKARLAPLVKATFDSVRRYKLCDACSPKTEVLGWGEPPKEEEVRVV